MDQKLSILIVYLLKCTCRQFCSKRRIFCRHCLLNVGIQTERPLWKMWRNAIGIKTLISKKLIARKLSKEFQCTRVTELLIFPL